MISIITAYYNRKTLFKRTLESIVNQNFEGNFEVIAVDDGSNEEERLEDLIQEFPFLKIIRLEKNKKWYSNSCIPFNIGINAAKGDKIIIQNPECYHYGRILDFTEKNLTHKNYICFSCFSLDKVYTDDLEEYLKDDLFIAKTIQRTDLVNGKDGRNGWYAHPIHRPHAFHFCCAISAKNLKKMGGFDELFSLGIGYDDNEFLLRIHRMQLKVEFCEEQIVLHQNHYSSVSTSYENRSNHTMLMKKNEEVYTNITCKKNYKANRILKLVPFSLKKSYIPLEIEFWKKYIPVKNIAKKIVKKK